MTNYSGGELYGTRERNSLHMLNRYFTKYPEDADKIVLSIKGAINFDTHQPDCTPEGVRRSVENCVKILGGTKKLDIFECARVDPNVPIETTMKALAELVKEDKIGGISLSEVKGETIRRAAKIHPITCVEVEVSLFEDNVFRNGVAKACADLNIPIIAYSPLSRGFLTGQIRSYDDLPQDDMRRHFPRFQPENFSKNMDLVHKVDAIAQRKACKPSQIAIAWVRQLSDKSGNPLFIPIPGASTVERVQENFTQVTLSQEELKQIDEILAGFTAAGDRYPSVYAHLNDG